MNQHKTAHKGFLAAVLLLLLSFCIWQGTGYLALLLTDSDLQFAQVKQTEGEIMEIKRQISHTKQRLADSGIAIQPFDENSYISLLTQSAADNTLSMNQFKTENRINEKGLSSVLVRFEIGGSFKKISTFLKSLNNSACVVQNISLRQSNVYLWLNRDFDDQRVLPWAEFEKAPEPPLPQGEEFTTDLATVSALFDQTAMRCYLELVFFGEG